ncbi:MAG: hypothetical protein HY537_08005 [Deltaproteobacteria bacterium]|nr:hypothetical protein [Deltaproteobacteria bacterium]
MNSVTPYLKINVGKIGNSLHACKPQMEAEHKLRQSCLCVWRTICTITAGVSDLFRIDPATYNERMRRNPYDYPNVRGLR